LRSYGPITVALTALALLGSSGAGSAQDGGEDLPTVAVLDFTGLMLGQAGNSAPLGKAVSSMLTTELLGRPGLRVIERYQLQDLLTEQKLALSGRVDEGTAVEIGKLLGAQYMIYGQVTSIATQLRMDMRAVDVETSEILEAQKMNATTDELLDVVVQMADAFGSQLDLTPPSGRPQMEAIPVRATIEFSRAVDFEDKGEKEKALEHYRAALEIFPAHPAAQAAVARLGAEAETEEEGDR
jgi:TolB-like protein